MKQTLHEKQLEQALRTWKQNPTPALASSIARLQRAIRYERRQKP